MPGLKAFLKEPDGVQRYAHLRVKFLQGAEPVLHVAGGRTVPLRGNATPEALNALVRSEGFALASATDAHVDCVDWSYKGQCYVNPDFMRSECAKSCADVEADAHRDCAYWASSGQCVANAEYMAETCSTSCGRTLLKLEL